MTRMANPYVGSRSFRAGQPIYGRDREAQELVDLLIAERIVLMHSPSGAGKTSLLNAAFLPAMRAEGFTVRPVMRVGSELPAEAPAGVNRYTWSCVQSLDAEADESAARAPGESLADYLSDPQGDELLVFDQFEEILTVDPMNRAAKEEFFTQLGALLRHRLRWALFSMRQDYVAALDPYVRTIPTRFSNRFALRMLEEDAALLAVREPAERQQVAFDGAAAHKLVDDLRRVRVQLPDGSMTEQLGLFIEPVQLQVVCYRLWEHLPENAGRIGSGDIGGAGDVNSALAGFYAESVAAIAAGIGVSERAIRDWCERALITAQGIRGQIMQGCDTTGDLPNRAIEQLVDRHLVRVDKRNGVTWFELAHDRLIEPVRASNSAWREANLSPMQKRASLWEEQRRPDSLLMLGSELAGAQNWAEKQSTLTGAERAFLEDSAHAQHAAEREKCDARRIRQLAAVSGLVALLAVGALIRERIASSRAASALTREQIAASRAATEEQKANEAANVAQQAQIAANRNLQATTALHLADVALSLRPTRLVSALLLSAAYRMEDTPETRSALAATAFYRNPVIASLPAVSNIKDLAVSPDGTLLATAGADGYIRFYGLDAQGIHDTGASLAFAADCIAFTADGQHLAAAKDGSVTLWQGSGTHWTQDPQLLKTGVAYRLSAGGNLLAVGLQGGVQLWDWRARRRTVSLLSPQTGHVEPIAFTPDGSRIAFTSHGGKMTVYDTGAGRQLQTLSSDASGAASVSFSPNGERLAWTNVIGNAYLKDSAQQEEMRVSKLPLGAFRPDGTLVFATPDRVLFAKDFPTRKDLPLPTLAPPIALAATRLIAHPRNRNLVLGANINEVDLMDARDTAYTGTAATFVGSNNKTLATIGPDGLKLWDVSTEKLVKSGLGGADKSWRAISASADGSALVAVGDRASLFCDLKAYRCNPLPGPLGTGDIAGVSFFPTGNRFATVAADFVGLWTAGKSTPDQQLQGSGFGSIVLGTNKAVTGAQSAPVWDLASGKLQATLNDQDQYRVASVAWSPNGKLVAYGKQDGSVANRNAAAQGYPQMGSLKSTGMSVNALAFSPDGKTLASGDASGHVQLWDLGGLAEGGAAAPIGDTMAVSAAPVGSLSFSADGSRLATGAGDGAAGVWDAAPSRWLSAICGLAGRNLTPNEWRQYAGAGQNYVKSCPNIK